MLGSRIKGTLDRWCGATCRQSENRSDKSSSGSGSTVDSHVSTVVGKWPSGTFARQSQGVDVRLNDLFMPRRTEFKGWVTDFKHRCRGLKDTKVSNLIHDLHKVPDAHKQRN